MFPYKVLNKNLNWCEKIALYYAGLSLVLHFLQLSCMPASKLFMKEERIRYIVELSISHCEITRAKARKGQRFFLTLPFLILTFEYVLLYKCQFRSLMAE